MVSLKSLSIVLAAANAALAIPHSSRCSVKEDLKAPPAGWAADDRYTVDKDGSTIKLRISLVNQDMDKFHDLATQISTPGNALYGKHLSQSVIDAMIAPKPQSQNLVLEWLESEGLGSLATVSDRLDSVVVEASISQIEALLKAEYQPYVRASSGDVVVRTLKYSLPDVLEGHVNMVQPTTFFGLQTMKAPYKNVRPKNGTVSVEGIEASAVTGCSDGITPTCLANLYKFTGAATETVGLFGIGGFLLQHPIKTDLKDFMSDYAYFDNTAETFTCALINGGTCPASDSNENNIVEANLDVQYARAITSEIPNVYYSTGGSPPIVGSGTNDNEPYLEFLDYLLGLTAANLPNTLSISYGDDEATVPLSYATEVCNLFSQLGARGVSVLVAAGDSGVGTTCELNGAKQFTTSFPAGCPWVTTVGGISGTSPEKAWTDGGAGFSEIFGRPSYQNATVNTWLSTDTTHTAVSSYFNHSGRAYPDVAAQATDFTIVLDGEASEVDGTSCATPTFASIIQLLNSQRIAAGKAGLGFLNPWLYSTALTALNDITSGKVTGCSGVISGAGFSAIAGWDPATGLGSPNYVNLLAISEATA